AKTCDFRSGRTILKRAISREEMKQLLDTGKTPLLEKFISKKGRPFSAFLVRQPDGKIGFEFEEREAKGGKGTKGAPASATAGALRVLGKHPDDDQEISVYSGRYGPYVKHGKTNATIPDKDKADSITLEEAVELLTEKFGAPTKKAPKKTAVKTVAKKAAGAGKTAKETKTKAAAEATAKPTSARKKKAA
ncbi:MAG: topoisomerase C-terminal repeat-containing protein, partial [Betaproteobacteria bacterium]